MTLGELSVFGWGALGGFVAQAIGLLVVVLKHSLAELPGLPKRLQILTTYVYLAAMTALGGFVAFCQSEALVGHKLVAIQIGLVAPLLFPALGDSRLTMHQARSASYFDLSVSLELTDRDVEGDISRSNSR